jgi:hypothetical protein
MNTNYNFKRINICSRIPCPQPVKHKTNTSGNDSTITNSIRYSEYIRTVKGKNVYTSGNAGSRLQKQGIISVQTEAEAQALGINTVNAEPRFVDYTFREPKTKKASLQFTNLNSFNAERLLVFSKNQISTLSIFPIEKL